MEAYSRDNQRDSLLARRGIMRDSQGANPLQSAPRKLTSDAILEQVRDLPALPTVVVKIMRLTSKGEGASPRQMAEVISQDPNFAARILKMANSCYYGLPRAVSTLSDAVMMLGSQSIRHLAMIAATQDTLRQRVPGYELNPGELWRHSVGTAWAVSELAKLANYAEQEEAFVAGLLHDVGKMVLGQYVQEKLPEIQAIMEAQESSFVEAERAVLGLDHAEIGGQMALHWNLPALLVQAIRWHHAPIQKGYVAPMTALVYLGNILCSAVGASATIGESLTEVHTACLHVLNLNERQVNTTMEQLAVYLESVPNAFGE